jgi:outer membrane protein TolC
MRSVFRLNAPSRWDNQFRVDEFSLRRAAAVIALLFAGAGVVTADDAQIVNTEVPPSSSFVITDKRTPTADAPAFGTKSWFRKVFMNPAPRIELQAPTDLQKHVVNGRIELSLRDYLDLVLANNTDIQIQRLSIEIPRNDILRSHSIFDPVIRSSFSATHAQNPAQDLLAGGQVIDTLRMPFNLNATKVLSTGTVLTAGYDGARFRTDSANQTINPSFNSSLNVRFEQPLLRGRGSYFTKMPVTIARSSLRQSEYQIEDQILILVTRAEQVYWDVIFARENLKVQEQNLKLNEELLKRAQRELELGVISSLEIYQPELQYKNAEIAREQARFDLQAAEDRLRRQIAVDLTPDLRQLPIELTESVAPPQPSVLEPESLVSEAYQQRPDLKAARQQLDIDELNIQNRNNLLKPDVRMFGAYGLVGLGGNFFPRPGAPLQPGVIVGPGGFVPGGLGDSLSQLFGFDNPTYVAGVQFNFPLRDRAAAANYADAVVRKKTDMLRLRNQEQQVRQEVLNAITQVEQSRASVALAEKALEVAQKRLEGDQKRYELGAITLFFLLDAQTSFNRAQSDLVNRTVQYRRNLTTLHRATGDLLQQRGIVVR